MKIETSVMVMKNGKAWGVAWKDGGSTAYGWISPEDAEIHDPKYLKKPEDVTYQNSLYINELRTAQIVQVQRRTEVVVKA